MDINFDEYKKNKLSPLMVKTVDDLKFYGNITPLTDDAFVKQSNEFRIFNLGETIKQDYKINEYNFRGKFDFSSTYRKVGFFGCSFTFGELVNDGLIFKDIVENNSNYNCFNFGILGTDIESIAYTFNAACRVINFDKAIIITLPDIYRSMYLESNKKGTVHRSISHSTKTKYKKIDDTVKTIYTLPPEFFIQRAITNINWIVSTAKQKGMRVSLTSWSEETYKILSHVFPAVTMDEMFPYIDRATDNLHPGQQSHAKFAEQVLSAI